MVETLGFKLIKKVGSLQIRKYSPILLASIRSLKNKESSYKLENNSFSRLADYIFEERKNGKIGMTAPVITRDDEKFYFMSFVMPQRYTSKSLPKPKSPIFIEKIPSRTLAVLRFTGFTSISKIDKLKEVLFNELLENKIVLKGKPFLMRYNSPWALPFLRRNELAVEVLV
jgi:hypothetical protein